MNYLKKIGIGISVCCLVFLIFLALTHSGAKSELSPPDRPQQISDHFDGKLYYNPGLPQPSPSSPGSPPKRGAFWYLWRWLISNDRPEWPEITDSRPGPPPATHVPQGDLRIIPIGHSTFLIQMDGMNILTDPIWSERCSPVSLAGPKRRQPPGIRFEELPRIDIVLVSHNHYDHLDLPTLESLASKGTPRALVPLGNLALVRESGIPLVEEMDWWQSIPLSPQVRVTLVPAQHFSSRTPWDRNKALWGGYVLSGPSGNVYFAGDTGYGPHFLEIARRFSPIRVALLPISPFRTRRLNDSTPRQFSIVHMGPSEAVQAHRDLKARLSLAAHFQVFQLGWDGFDDAVNELASSLKKHNLRQDEFLAPVFGQVIDLNKAVAGTVATRDLRATVAGW
ncbi:MAG: MBL fold metallo-hydrolase [Deltaproteobacteria bacterium]|nr:MBL fold metallo-hydrolase [Deltaproteobacteria bacterium]